jgi:hypothetical protein
MRSVIVDGERLVAVGHDGLSWTSVDGITWNVSDSNDAAALFRAMTGVAASDVGLVAVGVVEVDPRDADGDGPVQLDADGDPVVRLDAAVWLQE